MTDKEKTDELLLLIDDLCEPDFRKNNSLISSWIEKLNNIYTDNYRHSYSDIFFKVQKIISEEPDSEVLEILGENLNVLMDKICKLSNEDDSDTNYKSILSCYKKFADHIKLEIGRYNFIKSRFENNRTLHDDTSISNNLRDNLNDIPKEVQNLRNAVNNIRPVVTSAKKELDGIDEKLENNKISSITTLTIFSAVILAFSGGITFEAGIFEGMAESTPYRLVFTIALSGFILFNTIFALLYLVGKMAGKQISTRCKYITLDENETNKNCRSCGDGYCKKKNQSVNIFCRLTHKYSYVFAINAILIYVLYSDFFLWISNGEIKSRYFFIPQIALIVFLVALYSLRLLHNYKRFKRAKLYCKVDFLQKIVSSKKSDSISNSFTYLSERIAKSLGIKPENMKDTFLNEVKGMKPRKALKHLNYFVDEHLAKDKKIYYIDITREEHAINKKRMKRLKRDFKRVLKSESDKK